MYTLTGGEQKAESWLLNPSELLEARRSDCLLDLPYQAAWPVLHSWAIPERWLLSDPGFPILLRDTPDLILPNWCYPHIGQNKGRYGYRLKTSISIPRGPDTLVLAHSPDAPAWEEVCAKYHISSTDQWCWCGRPEDKVNWPQNQEVDYAKILFGHSLAVPSRLVDVTFGKHDTYSLLHLHCLINGSVLELPEPRLNGQVVNFRKTIYGVWEILNLR